MAGPSYLLLNDIVREIQAYKRAHGGEARVAISMTGGGARAAYEAGVAEALLQALRQANIRPAILTGTSGGAIAATGLFADLLYTPFPPPPTQIYVGQQSLFWREICDGNNGASRIGGDRAWIIKWITNEERLTALDNFDRSVDALSRAVDGLKAAVTALGQDFFVIPQATTTFSTGLRNRAPALSSAVARINADVSTMNTHARAVFAAWQQVDFLHPMRTLAAIQALDDALSKFVDAYSQAILDLTTGVPSDELSVVVDGLTRLVIDTTTFVTTLQGLLVSAQGDVTALIQADLTLGSRLVALVEAASDLITFISGLRSQFLNVAIVKNTRGEDVLTDHVLPNSRLRQLLRDFLRRTYLSSRPPPPPGTNIQRAIIDDWLARWAQGENVPELFLTASNITSSRLTVFAIASPSRVTSLAAHGWWSVDLTSTVPLGENILWPAPGAENQFVGDATITSAAYPIAFPPVKWNLHLGAATGPGMLVQQAFLDGGLLDNSPLDIAIVAGATHVFSIELSPLVDFLFTPIDLAEYDAFSVLFSSFITAMDGNMRDRIAAVVARNSSQGSRDPEVQIYRLAPLIPAGGSPVGVFSPAVMNFDGVFDANHQLKMSLYDWFMQGYTDAKGLDATSFPIDLLVLDYKTGIAPSPRGYVGTAKPGGDVGNTHVPLNKFWRASTQATPTALPH